MIKKLLGGLAVVGLCAGAALYLSSCAQQAGPLSPDLGLLNASSTTAESELPTATIVAPASVSQTAVVQFDIPMNAATINASNIQVLQQSVDGLSELPVACSVAYNAAAMQAIITPGGGGTWVENNRFHIIVGIGCQSVTGSQLDGNGNNIAEAAEFDNRHGIFTFGVVPTNFTSPFGVVQAYFGITVTAGSSTFFMEPGVATGGITAAYNYVTITVGFNLFGAALDDPAFAFDSGSFFTTATSLSPNVVITNVNGAAVTPISVAVSGSRNEVLTIVLSLQPASKYFFSLKGGMNGIRSPLALSTMAVVKGLRFDGNYNGIAEASDDWQTATIMTANVDNSALPAFTVNSSSYNSGLRRVTVVFDIPVGIGSGTLNPSTVNNNTFILIDEEDVDAGGNEPPKPIIPTSIQLNNTIPSAPEVYLYIPEKFSSDTGDNHDHTVRLIVTPGVLTAEGLAMDNNGDGVLGMPNDTYDNTFTVENHQQ